MQNCWEFMKCGLEPGGVNVDKKGECPVPKYVSLHQQNKGENAGRSCWLVKNTRCQDQLQGDFYSKIGNCVKCDFFKIVFKEEGENFSYGMNKLG